MKKMMIVTATALLTISCDPGILDNIVLATETPATDSPNAAKTSAIQESVNFILTNDPAFDEGSTWKVYTEAEGGEASTDVTATLSDNVLTLSHETDIPTGSYWVTVTEPGKTESGRLELTVTAYDPAKSRTPEVHVKTVSKTGPTQASVSFTLNNNPAFDGDSTWKVYTNEGEQTEAAGVTATLSGSSLTLTHGSDIPAGTYYVAVTEPGKTESERLDLTVEAYEAPAPSFSTPAEYRTMVGITGATLNATASNSSVLKNGTTVNSFKIGKYEIVWKLWKEVYDWATDNARGANKYNFANAGNQGHEAAGTSPGVGTTNTSHGWTEDQKELRPVTNITWGDAVVWCNAYSEMAGKTPVYSSGGILRDSTTGLTGASVSVSVDSGADGYRLPVETEWEFAARGADPSASAWSYKWAGVTEAFDWDSWVYDGGEVPSGMLDDYAWYQYSAQYLFPDYTDWDNHTEGKNYGVHPVGTKLPNSAGLYDMTGNVAEICFDGGSSSQRAVRGGAYNSNKNYSYVYYQNTIPLTSTGSTYIHVGFRVVSK